LKGYIETNGNVGEIVRKLEDDYLHGTTQISKYVSFEMHDNIEKIDAYLNSKHTSGLKDSQGREKPFFNIVTAAVNIWFRATDIDRKHIRIKASKNKDVIPAFLATVHVQDWMRKENFGQFLNEWGRTLARYGSAVCKFVEKEGELHSMNVPWNRIICDTIDFDGNVKIEILELTPSQLRKREGYDKEIVDKLCNNLVERETLEGQTKDQKNNYIKLYEVHGEMPLSYLTNDEKDSDKYVQQMHVLSFVEGKEKGDYDDYTLISGREERDPYMITHLIKEDGRAMAIGAVEHLFEAQWIVNHSQKAIKDQLDLASKLIFQTSDGSYVGRNALTAIENGDILIHKVNEPLTQVNNNSHDITAWQSVMAQWKSLGEQITGVSDAMMGQNPPSGTAWRLTEALLQESHSLFELMTENKGLHLEDMFRKYVIPFVKKKLDTKEEVSATLEANDIAKIDSLFIKNITVKESNEVLKKKILKGSMPTPDEQQMMMLSMQGGMQETLASMGNQRFFKPDEIEKKTWKDVFKDIEWTLEVDVTQEAQSTKDDLTTLNSVFQTIADPVRRQVLGTPEGKMLFNKILNATSVVSPLEISDLPSVSPTITGGGSPMEALPANQNVNV